MIAMRKLTVIAISAIVVFLNGNVLKAQGKYGADSAECIKYLSYYKEYFKQKNYQEALPNWRKAYKLCPPTANQTMLIDGTTLIRRLIGKNTTNVKYRNSLIDTLMTLHETRAKYYPKYAVTALNNKGTDMSNYMKNNPEALYKGLSDIIKRNKNQTKTSILLFNLNSAISLYQEGKLSTDDVIATYQRDMAILDASNPASESEREMNSKVKSDMEGLFISSKVASCDNLIALFTPRYEADPKNIDLVTNIVKMMSSTEDCTNNDLYLKAATSMHKLQPTAQSAYFLYRLNASRDNVAVAAKYMEEAIASDELDLSTKAAYNYEFATFCVKNGLTAKGYAAAQKSLQLDSSYAGKAYFLIGTIWGTTSCGSDDISKRAPYWVACDYMQKAKTADPTLTDECNRMISQYSVYFPQTADAFMYDLTNGQSYTVSCGGMRATTTVRTQN